jgi:hypothetical protein
MLTYLILEARADISNDVLNAAYASIRQHTSAYVSIRQHTSAYDNIRQHTYLMLEARADITNDVLKAYADACGRMRTYADVC